MNKPNGFTLVELLIVSALGLTVVMGAGHLYQSLAIHKQLAQEKTDLLALESRLQSVFKSPDQCRRNIPATVVFHNTDAELAAASFTLPSIAMYNPAGAVSESFAASNANTTITLSKFRKIRDDAKNIFADITIHSTSSTRISRDDLRIPNVAMEFALNPANGLMTFQDCHWTSPPVKSGYQGILVGAQNFTKSWTGKVGQEETHTLNLAAYPEARVVRVNGTCYIHAKDAGTGIYIVVRNQGKLLFNLSVCYLWGSDTANDQSVKAGQLLEIPTEATDVDIVLRALDGTTGDTSTWTAVADVNFFK